MSVFLDLFKLRRPTLAEIVPPGNNLQAISNTRLSGIRANDVAVSPFLRNTLFNPSPSSSGRTRGLHQGIDLLYLHPSLHLCRTRIVITFGLAGWISTTTAPRKLSSKTFQKKSSGYYSRTSYSRASYSRTSSTCLVGIEPALFFPRQWCQLDHFNWDRKGAPAAAPTI